MKLSFSHFISKALYGGSESEVNSLKKVKALFKAYRLITGINSLKPGFPVSDRLFLKMSLGYYSRVLKADQKNDFVVAYSLGCPAEILYAMGLIPFQLEATGWLLARLLGDPGHLLAAAGEAGLPSEICSVHRLMTGAFARQLFPRVKAVLWTNMPCENSAKSGALLTRLNNCPGYFLDHPCSCTPPQTEYLAAEFKSLVSFLEEKSGRKLSYSRLRESISHSNEQIALTREISQLRKHVPSPFPSFTFIRVFMTHILFGGRAEATAYLKTLRNEMAARVAGGRGAVASERFRLMNMNLPPLYFTGPLEDLFREYGAVEVINPFFMEWQAGSLDPSRPLLSLAMKSLMNPLMGIYCPLDQKVLGTLKQYVSDYKVDGAVNYAHIGCGAYGGVSRLVRDALKEAGVPVLDLSCDIADPTVVSPEEMHEQLSRFFELLEDR